MKKFEKALMEMNESNFKWLESRKTVSAKIDIETCDLWWDEAHIGDPYGVCWEADSELMMEEEEGEEDGARWGRVWFVCSPDSGGDVCHYDLSPAQRKAMRARIARSDPHEFRKIPLQRSKQILQELEERQKKARERKARGHKRNPRTTKHERQP